MVGWVSVTDIALVLSIHFIADFVLQSDKMAKNKSTSNKWLGIHVAVYSIPLTYFGWKFALFNGVVHFIVDYITSRISSSYWKKGEVHNFFVVIGADQLIHTVTLIVSYSYL